MKNIVFISHHLGGIGGVQKFISILASKFQTDGHNVHVIGCSLPKNAVYQESPSYKTTLLYEEDIFTTSPQKLFFDSLISKKSSKKIQNILDDLENPIVIVTNPLAYVFLKDVNLTKAKKVVGQIHTSTDFIMNKKGIYRAYKFFIKKYYKELNKVLMLTDSDAKEMSDILKWDNISYIENPIPNKKNPRLALLEGKKIVMLGRIDGNKQIDHAIEAILRIDKDVLSDWKLEIYGEGPLKNAVAKQIEEYGLSNTVSLCGKVDDVEPVYLGASITLLTSDKEGVPMTILESMSYGVPVVTYDCSPGISDIINTQNGALVEKNNIQLLSQNLSDLMSSYEGRVQKGKCAIHDVQRFQVNEIADKWYRMMNEEEKMK